MSLKNKKRCIFIDMANVRDSRAVETYLRNFEGEKARYQEILDITLCYGMQCLSQTFSLKGISCHELRAITGYDAVNIQDFYVRNESVDKEGGLRQQRTPLEVRTKPSHAWRDGEVEMPDFSKPYDVAEAVLQSAADSGIENEALYSPPPAFDEIDYLTKLLGKSLVDLAWKMFARIKGSKITTTEELSEQFLQVDQRKVVTTIPQLEMPVTSFAEFLGTYVTECVRQSQRTGSTKKNENRSDENCVLDSERRSLYARRSAFLDSSSPSSVRNRWRRSASAPRAAMSNTNPADIVHVKTGQKQCPLLPQPPQRQLRPRQVSRPMTRSKAQSELRTRRQKLLRVKKTQSQGISEAVARARSAEYDDRRELNDVRDPRLAPKIPISDITAGAAALKIVDDFMKGPLMDTFGRGDMPVSGGIMQLATSVLSNPSSPCSQKDSLEEELYGTTTLDSSFLGFKPGQQHRLESQPKPSMQKYDAWLGDFGPLHTKTVRTEGNEDDAAEPDSRARGTKFEWNFEHIPHGNHKNTSRLKAWRFDRESSDKRSTRPTNNTDEGLGEALSETSDPVFRWLEGAV